MYIVSIPLSKEDFTIYYKLRYKVLREPWSQPEGSEKDDFEDSSFHFFIKDATRAIAVCRLHKTNEYTGQIRYMAIDQAYQGRGLGKIILARAEEEALKHNIRKIELNARENAVEFYKKSGYKVMEESHLLWGTIQHYRMEKNLH